MRGGFSFCGIDIATVGLEYVPEIADTYIYHPSKPRIFEEVFDSHVGGYYYGQTREPKVFSLRCIFEESEIDRGVMSRIFHLFKPGRTGSLVFERRPWCEYIATVTSIDDTQFTNYLNGFILIEMKAYYPFSTCNTMWLPAKYKDFTRAMANTALFEKEEMIPLMKFGSVALPISETISKAPIILPNPGTEPAPVGIEIAGNAGTGVTITNMSTGQTCRFVGLTSQEFDGEKTWLYLDSLTGKTLKVQDGKSKLQFINHERGYLHLAPGYPCIRNMYIYTQDGTVYSKTKLYDHRVGETRADAEERYVGKYIWLDNKWCKITGVGNGTTPTMYDGTDEYVLKINQYVPDGLRVRASVYQMNEISVKADTTMRLTRLNFIYKPTFS